MSSSVVISVQALDGTWERIGTGRSAGIVAENVSPAANEWLSDTISFTLKRNPGAVYPDLLAFTPIMVSINGLKVWAGRLEEQPTRDGSEPQISVTARGWQYHLDDDLYWPFFVHTRLTDWKDIRSHPDANLGTWNTANDVEVGEGAIVLTSPDGGQGGNALAYFDAGEGRKIVRVIVVWATSAAVAHDIDLRHGDTISEVSGGGGGGSTVISTAVGTQSGTHRETLASPSRYVGLQLSHAGGNTVDEYARFTSVILVSDTAYESGDASVLTADQLVTDALDGCPSLLSTDTTGIEAQTFEIPEYAPLALQTPRTVIQAAKELEDALVQVDGDRRLIFKDRPQRPKFRVGAWSGAEFSDASAGSAAEIYNRILVTGTGPDGEELMVERSAGQQSGAPLVAITTPAPDNPSFATNTTSWTPGGSTITRDTGVYDTSPASGRWDHGAGDYISTTFTGTFEAGYTYVLVIRVRGDGPAAGTFGALAAGDVGSISIGPDGTFQTFAVAWTPAARHTSGVTLYLQSTSGIGAYTNYFDSLALFKAGATLVDRRNFRRTAELPTGTALVEALGQQLGDAWLSNHRATPFKGDLEVSRGGIREVVGGREVEPSELLINVGELVLFSNTIDPDTGAIGRVGRIVNVSLDADSEKARVSIDNESGRFAALLGRVKERVG